MLHPGFPDFPSLAEAVAACAESALASDPMGEGFFGDAIDFYTKMPWRVC